MTRPYRSSQAQLRRRMLQRSPAPTLTPQGKQLNRAIARVSGATLRSGNKLTLLHNGPETYDDWLGAIAKAQRWVHLDNYIFKNDSIGRRFADALAERAAAGVQVRVLYDWFGSSDVPSSFWRALRKAGVDVRTVNPPRLSSPLDVLQRDHRKLVAVDGTYASVGGVCISDPWLERDPTTGLPYRDTSVRICGPAIHDLECAFADVWDEAGSPLPSDERVQLSDLQPEGNEAVRIIVQEPGKMKILRVLEVLLAGVEHRVWIADAYFLAIPLLRQAMIAAAQDGVDVRILLPATNDLPLVGTLSRSGYRPLLEAGIRIFEYSGPMMHAKTTVADGWWSRIGSTNLNVTGLLTNWEIDLVAEDRRFGAAMERMFEDDLAHAREIRLRPIRDRRVKVQPTRPKSPAERRARRRFEDTFSTSGSRATAMVARVSGAALDAASGDALRKDERFVTGAIGAIVLLASLLSAKFPRVIAWPLALIGGLFGGVSVLRAVRPNDDDGDAPPPVRPPRLKMKKDPMANGATEPRGQNVQSHN